MTGSDTVHRVIRSRVLTGILLLSGLVGGSPAAESKRRLFIGTYTANGSKGIYAAQFDERNGHLSKPSLAVETVDPSFLIASPTLPVLYAVNEGNAQVSAFAVSPGSGELKPMNRRGTGGGGPCHLAIDPSGRMLLVANYGGGSFSSFPILADGQIGAQASFVQFTGSGPNQKRQEAPHAHFAFFTPDRRFAMIDDLGTDRIMQYRIHPETATVDPADPPFAAANPGSGPRRFVLSPNRRFVYALNEIQSTVTRFSYSASAGSLRNIDTVSALPAGFQGASTAAEIAIDPRGRWLIVSNRGDDSLVVFTISRDGTLQYLQRISSGGRGPRHFTVSPSAHWLLAANQDTGNISVFHLDRISGRLRAANTSIDLPSPVCLLFR